MGSDIARTSILRSAVIIGDGSIIDEYVIIGIPPRDSADGELTTMIGPRALIRSHSVLYAGNVIGSDFQSGHSVLLRELNEIGNNVSIGSHSVIEHHVRIGNGVRIHTGAFIPEYTVLEDDVWIGPHAVITNARYPRSSQSKANLMGPHLRNGAKIGANATLLPGITIGRDSLVGAGAVVVHDVPDQTVVVGNPARVVRQVTALTAYQRDSILGQLGDG